MTDKPRKASRFANLPNTLTLARIALTVLFLALLWYVGMNSIAAFVVFVVAAATDWFDGHFARTQNLTSPAGKFLDPIADKLLVILPLILFAYSGAVSPWFVIIVTAREILVSAFRLLAVEQGIVLGAGITGKVKTVVQLIWVGALTLNIGVIATLNPYLGAASAILAAGSALEYFITNKNVFKALI